MQIWIMYDKISETEGRVTTTNYHPSDPVYGISAEQAKEGLFVDNIAEPLAVEGQTSELHIKLTTLTLFYVYSSAVTQLPQLTLQEINDNQLTIMDAVAELYLATATV